MPNIDRKWWKEAVVYQIYPRSFKDSDGDGVGDLRGIIEKLDYIKSLGVDTVWLTPVYPSPNDDNGYDVSDYCGIHPDFGSMADFDELLEGMHARGLRLVMDIVVNHSSDEHPWFVQSRSSRDNPYRDYYHWWPAEKGKPNYRYSFFDEDNNAWQYDAATDAYYLHYFSVKQPDLNWDNPEVRREVYKLMNFWAAKGVDGFRLDAFQLVAKDPEFPPLPESCAEDIKHVISYQAMDPKVHDYLQEMHREVFSKYDLMTVAEGAGNTFADAHALVDAERNELNMAYHFDGVHVGSSLAGYTLAEFRDVYTRWEEAFAEKGWLAIYLANHDVPRMVSKYGNDSPELRAASATLLNTFVLSMRGTPYVYYGDELGMTNTEFEGIADFQDIAARNSHKKALKDGVDMDTFMAQLKHLSRDNSRTPMQWDASPNAGFSSGTPWLRVNPNHSEINVAVQENHAASPLNYFRRLVQLRKDHPVLVYGSYQLWLPEHEQVYAYSRRLDDAAVLVLLNFSDAEASVDLPVELVPQGLLISNLAAELPVAGKLVLQPYQAIIFAL
ncbi:MAG: alpha-glucosidase [Gammaproteobacteria bacterium]|nr:alpha-glucosidase [Gammaproteobacteria bacterium]